MLRIRKVRVTCTRETSLIKEYRSAEGKGEVRKQNSTGPLSQGLLLLRELISAMVAPRNSVTTVNTAIAHRMRAAGTSVGNGIIGETAQLAVFADFCRTLYCTEERSVLVEADAQEPEPH